ncbi:MAG: hypothetical protein KF912_12210 [Phycisphaeraceae bacterium]|nr:hypothetical protein [Phycisphaeraceae bacterium]MBX3368066.1 hypothetical protein [Phycisphaeraceae bacterium]
MPSIRAMCLAATLACASAAQDAPPPPPDREVSPDATAVPETAPATNPTLATAESVRATPVYQATVEENLAFERATLGAEYERLGDRNSKWDAVARDFLEEYAQASADQRLTLTDRPRLRGYAARLRETGCSDPLVNALVAQVRVAFNDAKNPVAEVSQAAEALRASNHSLSRKAWVEWKLAEALANAKRPDEAALQASIAADAFIALAADRNAPRIPSRYFYSRLRGFVTHTLDETAAADFCNRFEQATDDQWLSNMLWASLHESIGWRRRGGGFTNTVTQEGWKGYDKLMPLAAKRYEAAHALAPDRPEAASSMISLSNMGFGSRPDDPVYWFRAATDAEFDHIWAYRTLRWHLRPRWGGSYAMMISFATWCVKSGRFDTEVPLQYLEILDDLVDEVDDTRTIMRVPGVYETIEELAQAYSVADPPAGEARLRQLRTVQAIAAWHTGRRETLARIYNDTRRNLDTATLTRFRVPDGNLRAEAFLAMTANAAAYDRMWDSIQNNDFDGAHAIAVEARASTDEARKQDIPIADLAVKRTRLLRDYHAGDWADLELGAFASWDSNGGAWITVDHGAVRVSTSKSEFCLFRLLDDVGARYEAQIDIDFSALHVAQGVSVGFAIGYEWMSSKNARWVGACVLPGAQRADVALGWARKPRHAVPIDTRAHVRVVRYDDRIIFTVNGQEILDGPLPVDDAWSAGNGLAIGGILPVGAGQVQFSNGRIRKLTECPPQPGGDKPRF